MSSTTCHQSSVSLRSPHPNGLQTSLEWDVYTARLHRTFTGRLHWKMCSRRLFIYNVRRLFRADNPSSVTRHPSHLSAEKAPRAVLRGSPGREPWGRPHSLRSAQTRPMSSPSRNLPTHSSAMISLAECASLKKPKRHRTDSRLFYVG